MPSRFLTIKEKSNLINDLENNNVSVSDAANNYKCNVRTVFRCLSNREFITRACDEGFAKKKR